MGGRLCCPIALSPHVTSPQLKSRVRVRVRLGRRNLGRQGDGATQPTFNVC